MAKASANAKRYLFFTLLFASSILLAGCGGIHLPLVEVRPEIEVSNITINVPENISVQTPGLPQAPNASIPDFGVVGINITIAGAPDNLTICVVGLETNASNGLFNGNFTYSNRNFAYHPEYYSGEDELGECNLFVVKGDSVGEYAGRSQRNHLVQGVNDGVSMLFNGLALTKVKEDPAVDGWSFIINEIMPVQSGSIAHELFLPPQKRITRGFKFMTEGGVWQGFTNFAVQSLEIYQVDQTDGATVTAEFSMGPTSEVDLAIVEKVFPALGKAVASGRIVYFSYDAFDTRDSHFKEITRQAVVFLLQDFLRKRFIA